MLSWIMAGVEYSLDDKTITYMLGHDGLGMPAMRRLSERGALQDGDTDRGYRLDPRIVILTLGIKGSDSTDFYDKRGTLIEVFKPQTTAGTLRYVLNGTTRDLSCHMVEGLRFSDDDRNYLFQKCAVALKANDPTWYDPAGKNKVFALAIGTDTFLVPTEVPMTVGESALDMSQNITYNGTVKTYPRLRITGPVTSPVITHVQMDWKLDFTGTTIAAGEYYDIDLRYGYKTVTEDDGTNRIATLTSDSDLAEFCLLPAPEVGSGINTISVVGTAADPDTAVTMTYFERYLGL